MRIKVGQDLICCLQAVVLTTLYSKVCAGLNDQRRTLNTYAYYLEVDLSSSALSKLPLNVGARRNSMESNTVFAISLAGRL